MGTEKINFQNRQGYVSISEANYVNDISLFFIIMTLYVFDFLNIIKETQIYMPHSGEKGTMEVQKLLNFKVDKADSANS